MRSARVLGNERLILPADCSGIDDVHFELIQALEHANRVLDWHENLMKAEIPPQWMWPFEEQLTEWFEEVERKRNEGRPSADGDDDAVPMMRNEFADGRGR